MNCRPLTLFMITPMKKNWRWDEIEAEERQNHVMNVGEGNVLMANGRPVISAQGHGFFAYIPSPDGYRVPLIHGDNGEAIIPTPAEIEEMKANGEGEWVEPSDPTASPTHRRRMADARGFAPTGRRRQTTVVLN